MEENSKPTTTKRRGRLLDTEQESSHFQSQTGKLYEQTIHKRKIQAAMKTVAGMT